MSWIDLRGKYRKVLTSPTPACLSTLKPGLKMGNPETEPETEPLQI